MWIAPIILPEKPSLKQKSTNEVSEFEASTHYMRYFSKNGKCCFPLISHRRSNDGGVKCLSLALCAFHAEDSLFYENRIGAIHIFRFTKLISHSSFTIIRVNCAFGFVSDYVIVTDIMLLV